MVTNATTDYMITRRPKKRIENNHRILCECQECLSNLWLSDIESRNHFRKLSETARFKRWVDLPDTAILALWHICKLPVHLEKPDDIAYRFAGAISFALQGLNYDALCLDVANEKEKT
jgi:hypothetical protein